MRMRLGSLILSLFLVFNGKQTLIVTLEVWLIELKHFCIRVISKHWTAKSRSLFTSLKEVRRVIANFLEHFFLLLPLYLPLANVIVRRPLLQSLEELLILICDSLVLLLPCPSIQWLWSDCVLNTASSCCDVLMKSDRYIVVAVLFKNGWGDV